MVYLCHIMRQISACFLFLTLLIQMNMVIISCSNAGLNNSTYQISTDENIQEIPGVEPLIEYLEGNAQSLNGADFLSSIAKNTTEQYLLSNGVIAIELPPPDPSFI